MFKIVDKKDEKYLIVDTDDGVIEEYFWQDIIGLVQDGFEIEGCHYDYDKCHIDIDNSNYKVIYKGYKFRLYPNKAQEEYFQKCFGCCRLVYNQMLARKIEHYRKTGNNLVVYPSDIKKDYTFLKEVDSQALTQEYNHLEQAYNNFFRNKEFGFPKFKRKHDSYKAYSSLNINNCIRIEGNKIRLPKIGFVKVKLSQPVIGQLRTVTISQVPSGKYYISFSIPVWIQELYKTDKEVGLDLGIKTLITTSSGVVYENPKTLVKYEKQLARLQRQLAHKQKGSSNYNKQRIKIARLHEKIANIRKDNIHKITHKLVSENQVIVSEDLSVKNMLKNHHLAKSISDVSWYEITRQLDYKSNWRDRTYIKVDRFYPSSQICSCCGYKNTEVKDLSVRSWTCPNCDVFHDRDKNAANNILAEGKQLLISQELKVS